MAHPVHQALRILYPIKKGSSNPVVAEASDGRRYLVKLRGSQSSPYAAPCDFLACRLGYATGLPVVEPALVEISEATELHGLDDEMRDAVAKSCGINLGYLFHENAGQTLPEGFPDADLLFAFDCFLINIDRTAKNLNLLQTSGGYTLAFDFEASMLFMGLLQGIDFGRSAMALREMRKNPIYRPDIAGTTFDALFELLRMVDPASICSYPAEWSEAMGEPHDVLQKRLFEGLCHALQQPGACLERYASLSSIPLESEEARQAIVDANRRAFEAGMKKKL